MFDLTTRDIKYLQGVGPQRAAILNKELEIYSFKDLLYYFPYKYVDRSRVYLIREIDGNMPYIQLRGKVLSFETLGEGRQRRLVGHFSDGTGVVDLVWFQGLKFITGKYKANEEYIVFGKPTVFNGRINIAHPDIDPAAELTLSAMGLQPYYNTTERMKRSNLHSNALTKLMKNLFGALQHEVLEETLSPSLVEKYRLMPLTQALYYIHFPQNPEQLRRAQYRLKFEELFYVQLNILRYTKERRNKFKGLVFSRVGEIFNTFYSKHLPFQLTGAQKRVIKEMRRDMGSGRQMNRLLQGDVGSGKTLVALMTMLIALDNGYQACMMAPTEILATQHYETVRHFLEGMDVRVELLTGTVKGKRREAVLKGLLTGEVHILIGTHAVIEDTVNFASLGLVVIDEQHRFGVAQRAKLWAKNTCPPHVLVMTATPIPRTLAMTLYGDLDVSVIDELPPGRKPIQTVHQLGLPGVLVALDFADGLPCEALGNVVANLGRHNRLGNRRITALDRGPGTVVVEVDLRTVGVGHLILRTDELRVLDGEGEGQVLEVGGEELLRGGGKLLEGDGALAAVGERSGDTCKEKGCCCKILFHGHTVF